MKRFFLSGVLSLLLMLIATVANAAVTITSSGGWFESAYVEFETDASASYYNVYYSTSASGPWTKIDDQLVRKYSDHGRADVIGISAGTYYVKVASVNSNGTETSNKVSGALTVKAHDRGGFAHFNWSKGVGAYKNDGTLKSGAIVKYVCSANAKTMTMEVASASNKTTTYTGFQTILDALAKAYSKGWSSTPVAFRVLGTLKNADMDKFSSSAEGIQVKGASAYSDLPITIEGVGNDAVIHGFGFLIRNTTDVELRNFAIMDCLDDCVSMDTSNSHIWVHNLDFFYGQAGSDSDQKKGDGTVDLKGDSQYITISYNRFWDSGKSSLCGMKSETGPNYITYHHNWFDHSDSRHPRIRTMSVHVYNNYFDGNAKYGVGTTMGSSCFVESNYFRGCKYPMMRSLNGSDAKGDGTFSGEATGYVKAYGNYITGATGFISSASASGASEASAITETSSSSYDAVVVTSKSTKLSDGYDNFDTNSSLMYSYTADAASTVPTTLAGNYGAGRLQHGSYTYDLSGTDASYAVITALKSAVEGYCSGSYYTPITSSSYFKSGALGSDTDGGDDSGDDPSTVVLTLSDLQVGGETITGFSSSKTSYSYTCTSGTTSYPAVTYTLTDSNASASASSTAWNNGGTYTISVTDGSTTKTYTITFTVGSSGSSDDDENIDSSSGYELYFTGSTFSNTSNYTVTGTNKYTTGQGTVTVNGTTYTTALKMESATGFSINVDKERQFYFAFSSNGGNIKIDGTKVAASSTSNILVTTLTAGTHTITKADVNYLFYVNAYAADDDSEEEATTFTVTSSANPTAGGSVTLALSGNTVISSGTSVESGTQVTATATPNSGYKFSMWDDESTSTTNTRTITENTEFIATFVAQNSDASLSDLKVDGTTITGFASGTTNYSVVLASGTTDVPAVTATCTASTSNAVVTATAALPGATTVVVTAENGSQQTYTINFTVASSGSGSSTTLYSWNGNGSTTTANETGGTAVATNDDPSKSYMEVGKSQKGNYTLKIGSSASGYDITITLDNALSGGETLTIGNFISVDATGKSGQLKISYQNASGTEVGSQTGTLISTASNVDVQNNLSSNGTPVDETLTVPTLSENATKIVLTRNSGLTGATSLYVSKFIITTTGSSTPTYTVAATNDGNGSATATVDNEAVTSVEEGTSVTFTATPNSGYKFVNWTDNNNSDAEVSTASTFAMSIATNTSYKANFTAQSSVATISDLAVGGIAISEYDSNPTISGNTTTYSVTLPVGTTNMPAITYTLDDAASSAEVSYASDFTTNNTTTITVTAENGSTQVYQIVFTVASSTRLDVTETYVFSTLNATDIAANSWITPTGITTYDTRTISSYINPSTNATSADVAVDAAQVKSTQTLAFRVQGANAVAVYAYHRNTTDTRNIVITDGTASETFAVGPNTTAAYSTLSITDPTVESTITVRSDETKGVYVYAVKFIVNEAEATSVTFADGTAYTAEEDKTYEDGVTYTRTFGTAEGWNALYVPFAINVEDYTSDVEIFEILNVTPMFDTNNNGMIDDNDRLYMVVSQVTTGNTLPNMPYFIRPKAATSYSINAVDGAMYAAAENIITCASTKRAYKIQGVNAPVSLTPNDGKYYVTASGKFQQRTTSASTLSANRWYMTIEDRSDGYNTGSSQSDIQSIEIAVVGEDIDEATAVKLMESTKKSVNGEDVYKLNGIKLNEADVQEGIYIKNGTTTIK